MFTGIIEKKAKILSISKGVFEIENIFYPEKISVGQSIAHNGACMTVTEVSKKSYYFFMMEESLKKTNFGGKKVGDYINIERCLKVNDRIDGHFVSGHIDTTGKISFLEKKEDDSLMIGVSFQANFSKYTIEKGSISLNGVSLTIVDIEKGYISVSLIPLTQDWTNLGKVQIGDILNVEFDVLGKYILNKK